MKENQNKLRRREEVEHKNHLSNVHLLHERWRACKTTKVSRGGARQENRVQDKDYGENRN